MYMYMYILNSSVMNAYSLTELSGPTALRVSCMYVHYSLVTWPVVTVSFFQPQHAFVMYNDRSLSRSKFLNHLPGGFEKNQLPPECLM